MNWLMGNWRAKLVHLVKYLPHVDGMYGERLSGHSPQKNGVQQAIQMEHAKNYTGQPGYEQREFHPSFPS